MTNEQKRIPVILDCDNTFGVPGCDVDDGLALLYLLGCPEVDLLGITCSYGNSTQEVVYETTRNLLKLWKREDIPLFHGASSPDDCSNDAAVFLANTACEVPDLHLLVTGATTNLKGAAALDPQFFSYPLQVSMMGGLTEELFVNGRPMAELNFSCDPEASLSAFQNFKSLRIATAQNCLASYFPFQECQDQLNSSPAPIAEFMRKSLQYWYDEHKQTWKLDGIVNWDVMAAVALIHPELFDLSPSSISPDLSSLKTGWLLGDGNPILVELPQIKDVPFYRKHVYEHYLSARILSI